MPISPLHRATILLAALALAGCAGMPPAQFSDGKPTFEPDKFFAGHTRSWGVIETRTGAPAERITTESRGRWVGGAVHIEQDLAFESGQRQHRSWQLRRLDAHHYVATGSDIVGEARGVAYGNTFHWDFTAALSPGNPLTHLSMSQWMYLLPDGRTMINRDTISKAGLTVAQATEQFRLENR